MTNNQFKEVIAAFLSKSVEPKTPKDVALHLSLDPTKSRHYDILRWMLEANEVEKIDGKYTISDYGIMKYGLVAGADLIAEKSPMPATNSDGSDFVAPPEESNTQEISGDDIEFHAVIYDTLAQSAATIFAARPEHLPVFTITNKDTKIDALRSTAPILHPSIGDLMLKIADDLEML
jgi:hypothetical protein